MGRRRCPDCGKRVPDTEPNCPRCGHAVAARPAEEPRSDGPAPGGYHGGFEWVTREDGSAGPQVYCSACRRPAQPDWTECPWCRIPLPVSRPQPEADEDGEVYTGDLDADDGFDARYSFDDLDALERATEEARRLPLHLPLAAAALDPPRKKATKEEPAGSECPACGRQTRPNWEICPWCGQDLPAGGS